jgi:putative chitinase
MTKELLRTRLLADARLKDQPRWIAYVMATVQHETGNTFEPLVEKYGKLCRHCYVMYDKQTAASSCKVSTKHDFLYDADLYFTVKYEFNARLRLELGNLSKGDGPKYKGRGFVQITGKRNYSEFARMLNVPLIEKPELAEGEDVAYEIMVRGMTLGTFTGKKLSDFISKSGCDYNLARKIINGMDKALKIAQYAAAEEKVLGLAA